MRPEQRPARLPDTSGAAMREGVSLHYDTYGEGATTVLLVRRGRSCIPGYGRRKSLSSPVRQRPQPFAAALQAAKQALDPADILNPGVILG